MLFNGFYANLKILILHPWESTPEIDQEPVGVTKSLTLLGPVLLWSQQNYLRLQLIVTCLES